MSSQLKQRVDTTLSGLSWREADSMRTLQMMKGEIKVKKRLSFGMAIAMALILASMALAVAEIVRYSVKEYQALDNKVAEQHITAIGQELKHEDVEIYVTDSLFDGSILSLAFEAKPISGKPVYVIAKLTAKSGDQALSSHVYSAKGLGFEGGFWVPERGLGAAGGRYGLDMQVDVGDAKGDISWELSFDVLRPAWEIVEDTSGYSDDSDSTADDHDAWEKQFETAYQNKQIMLVQGHSLMMFENLLPEGKDMGERLVDSGAFTRAGEMKASWVSPPAPVKTQSSTERIKGDGFEVELVKMDASFMRVDYEFILTITNPDKRASLWNKQGELRKYEANAAGMKLREVASGAGVMDYDEKATKVSYVGGFTYGDELPESITFKPYFYNDKGEKEFTDDGDFTIKIK